MNITKKYHIPNSSSEIQITAHTDTGLTINCNCIQNTWKVGMSDMDLKLYPNILYYRDIDKSDERKYLFLIFYLTVQLWLNSTAIIASQT